ncbi:MAG: hypothetical protein K8I27_04785 [Planctomycetes bacterium]|nr:hypothetical protein [Planctomycetota bacterium]
MLEYVTTHDDPYGVFSRWLIDGAKRANTDHGRLYPRVTQSGGDTTVSLYRDAARTQLVADGTINGATGEISLVQQGSSGLSGSVELTSAVPFDVTIDVFYADDDDVTVRQKDVAGFLDGGEFAGRPGFAEPLARAKRVIDVLLNARCPQGWRADVLSPLADACATYALFFIYDHLSTRPDDPAAALATHWRREARLALPLIRLSVASETLSPFTSRVTRA